MISTQPEIESVTKPHSAATASPIIPVAKDGRPLERLILTGFMGAGKSTIGRLLAASLGWNFLDLDAHLEELAGVTIPEIFARHGEARFRRIESSALASALSRRSTIIALGGGAPESLTNRLLIEQTPRTFTIFLDAPFPILFDRCILQEIERPVLADPEAAQSRFAVRHPLYTRLAGLTIKTADLTPEETVQALLASLKNSTQHRR